MRCPFCHVDGADRVIDSRPVEDGRAIRRRRTCEHCSRRYTTYERIEDSVRLTVIKKDGSRVPFDRAKILTGIQKACYKRPVPAEAISRMVDQIEEDIQKAYPREVPAVFIGEQVMRQLRLADQIAYVRFASVYREFRDLDELVEDAKDVMQNHQKPDPGQHTLFTNG
ncbi:MAG: transcriptional regulator NrdR [Phycisphaerae bacterium]